MAQDLEPAVSAKKEKGYLPTWLITALLIGAIGKLVLLVIKAMGVE